MLKLAVIFATNLEPLQMGKHPQAQFEKMSYILAEHPESADKQWHFCCETCVTGDCSIGLDTVGPRV